MSDIEFEGEQWTRSRITENNEPNGLIGFVIKNGLAKDEQQATIVLVILLIIIVASTIFVLFFSGPSTSTQHIPVDLQKIDQSKFSTFH